VRSGFEVAIRPLKPSRLTPAGRSSEKTKLLAAMPALVRALADRLPAGPAGEPARRLLAGLLLLPEPRQLAELPRVLAAVEHELEQAGEDVTALHAWLREHVREAHPELILLPAMAEWLETPHRQASMLSWLLRENVERLEQLGTEVSSRAAEADRLRAEIARLRGEQRAVARELEHRRSLSDLGLVAAGIVHDFNNVLQAVAGHASIVQSGALPEQRESLERILEATRRASELTRSLLAWVRHREVEPAPVDASAVVSDMLDLLASSAPEKVLMVRRLGENLPLVLADPVELRRVVLNLVSNAWQAIGDRDGQVVVTTGASTDRGDGVFLQIEDDGRGMDADTSSRVFEPFFSTRAEGAGLGLATVNELVARMDGTIEVWSEPGRGARFRVVLPAHEPGTGR
jgi:signal transduction histidine kinase